MNPIHAKGLPILQTLISPGVTRTNERSPEMIGDAEAETLTHNHEEGRRAARGTPSTTVWTTTHPFHNTLEDHRMCGQRRSRERERSSRFGDADPGEPRG